MRSYRPAVVLLVALALVGVTAPVAMAGEPAVSPITGGTGEPSLLTTNFDLASVGYEREEFFLEGEATAYASSTPLTADGKWKVTPVDETAPFNTRIIVYRPIDAADFSGTVFVEWLNVSAGFDTSPVWNLAHNQILRSGAAWVGVSAQAVGVIGGGQAVGGQQSGGLKGGDPERYGTLAHPGDSYSYDIFTQAGLAVRGTGASDPLGGMKAKDVIAMGESQSAFRMVTYVNAVQPVAEVFDGFLVHSRGSNGASLLQTPLPSLTPPDDTKIRSDLDVPVLTFQTETDLRFGHFPPRQADTKRFALWEVAGTSHADSYTADVGFDDTGAGQAEVTLLDVANGGGGPLNCAVPINAGPQYAVLQAALSHLEAWVVDGKSPPRAQRLRLEPGLPAVIERDANDNALGGIRTPLVDAPNATLRGDGNSGGERFCQLFGTTVPLSADTIADLYSSHDDYVAKFTKAADAAVKAGFLLEPEADNFKAAAEASTTGS